MNASGGHIRREDADGIDLSGLPRRRRRVGQSEGHIYVLEFDNGLSKVGRTTEPNNRIRSHAEQAGLYGSKLIRLWLSCVHSNFARNEEALIAYAHIQSSIATRAEYFNGLDFSAAVAFAKRLDFTPLDLAAQAAWQESLDKERAARIAAAEASRPTSHDVMADAIARVFGAQPDGSHRTPINFRPEGVEDLLPLFQEIARRRGIPVGEVLDLDWIDLLESYVSQVVRTEALRLRTYALEHGVRELLQAVGESIPQSQHTVNPLFMIEGGAL